MNNTSLVQPNLIIVDRNTNPQLKVYHSMLKREAGKPAIAVINQKLEDLIDANRIASPETNNMRNKEG